MTGPENGLPSRRGSRHRDWATSYGGQHWRRHREQPKWWPQDEPWPPVGDVVEVPETLAAYMLEHGEAEVVREVRVPEAAVVIPTERAVKPAAHGRKG